MIIKNSTEWSTEDLRKFFKKCVKEVDRIEQPRIPFHQRNKHFQLDILNGRQLRGRATLDGFWIMIKIPKDWRLKTEIPTDPPKKTDEKGRLMFVSISSNQSWVCLKKENWKKEIKKYPDYWKVVGAKSEMDKEQKIKLARLIIHEYYHTIGYKNQDRCNYKHDYTKKWDIDWADQYIIKEKEIIKKPKADIKLKRYQQAIQNLRKAETRLKRAKTLHQKWQTKIKYYQKTYNFNK